MRKMIEAQNAVAIGAYSHAIDSEGLIYFSGQSPVTKETGKLAEGGIKEQTEQCFKNLFAVLDAAGLKTDDVQKVNVYLTDMENFAAMNEVYKQQFHTPFPARTTVGVASLPLNALVEIEMIARRPR